MKAEIKKKKRKVLSEKEKIGIVKKRVAGLSPIRIANHYGCTKATVYRILRERGEAQGSSPQRKYTDQGRYIDVILRTHEHNLHMLSEAMGYGQRIYRWVSGDQKLPEHALIEISAYLSILDGKSPWDHSREIMRRNNELKNLQKAWKNKRLIRPEDIKLIFNS